MCVTMLLDVEVYSGAVTVAVCGSTVWVFVTVDRIVVVLYEIEELVVGNASAELEDWLGLVKGD